MTDWIPTLVRHSNNRVRWVVGLALALVAALTRPVAAQNHHLGSWMHSILHITGGQSVTDLSQGLARFLLFYRAETGELRSPVCSASRIGKGVFLTARHCLTPIETRGAKANKTILYKDSPAPVQEWNLSTEEGGKLPAEMRVSYSATGLKAIRAYTFDSAVRDIAVILTESDEAESEEELTIFRTRELSFDSKEGKSCKMLKAYGFAASEQPKWGYFCRAQNRVSNDLYFFAAKAHPLACDTDPTLLSLSEPGDSGGPATLTTDSGEEEIVGVISMLYTAAGESRKQAKLDSLVGLKFLLQAAREGRPTKPSPPESPLESTEQ